MTYVKKKKSPKVKAIVRQTNFRTRIERMVDMAREMGKKDTTKIYNEYMPTEEEIRNIRVQEKERGMDFVSGLFKYSKKPTLKQLICSKKDCNYDAVHMCILKNAEWNWNSDPFEFKCNICKGKSMPIMEFVEHCSLNGHLALPIYEKWLVEANR